MKASDFTVELAAKVARLLQRGPSTKADMVGSTGASMPSIQRSLTWLREDARAPLTFDRETRLWRLGPGWSFPVGRVGKAELIRAWAEREQLRRLLEADDVLAEVESMILGGL